VPSVGSSQKVPTCVCHSSKSIRRILRSESIYHEVNLSLSLSLSFSDALIEL
jgi:hypothetical protein